MLLRSQIMAVLTILACSAVVLNIQAADNNWANWRGPNFNGTLDESSPPTSWDASTNIKWKVPVPGKGIGSPIVWEDQIILLAAIDTGKAPEGASDETAERAQAERQEGGRGRRGRGFGRGGSSTPANIHEFAVISFSLKDGKENWRSVVHSAAPHERGHNTNTFASSSAVTDGEHIFASFGSNGVYCLDMKGEVIWSKDLGQMETRNQFGEGSSPALFKDTLIVPWDHEGESKLYALDATNGEIRWETPRDERTTWATPLMVEFNDQVQVITNGTQVRSYDLETGKLIWSCGGQVSNPIPTPVRMDDFVVCMTGYRGNSIYAMPLSAEGDITDSDAVIWNSSEAAPYVASPTLYKGQLYFSRERSGVASSVDAKTGEVKIPLTRLPGISDIYASPVAAGDKVYFTGRNGTTVVIKHGSEFEVLSVNELGEPVDASPAIIGNDLLIRSTENLYRIGE